VTLQDVYVGAIFTVFSRKLKVIDYADEFTRSRFLAKQK
jgi:nucleoside-diphosphate kinase